jgi:hypothetical protein
MVYFAGFAGTLLTLPLWLPTPRTLRFLRAREHLTQAVRRARDDGAGADNHAGAARGRTGHLNP